MDKFYFAPNGSFGLAQDLLITGTKYWTAQQWERIDAAANSELITVAKEIAANYPKSYEPRLKLDYQACYNTEDLIKLFKKLKADGYSGLSLGLIIDLIADSGTTC